MSLGLFYIYSKFSSMFKSFYVIFIIIKFSFNHFQSNLVKSTLFLPTYYSRNELVWLDGFLFDFLQKKTADVWLRKFVIYTGFIFSERLVFDIVVRVYLDNVLWPLHYNSLLEASNVTEMLTISIFFYFFMFSIIFLIIMFLF